MSPNETSGPSLAIHPVVVKLGGEVVKRGRDPDSTLSIVCSDIAGLLEQSGHAGTTEQRRERVRTLLHREDAPRKHITVGGTDYYERAAIDRLLAPPGDS